MAIKKSSNLMTTGGVMAAVGGALFGAPIAILQGYAVIIKDGPPHWLLLVFVYMLCVGGVLGPIGVGIMGVAGKGQDDVPTVPQVDAATIEAKAQVQVQAAKADPAGDK